MKFIAFLVAFDILINGHHNIKTSDMSHGVLKPMKGTKALLYVY